MTVTTSEFWDWQGTPLNQPWWNVTSFGGSRQDLPLLRGQNYPVAFRGGQMWRPKQADQRVITLAMWAAGVDQVSGNPAADQRLAFNNNFQQLRSMFWLTGNAGSALGALTRRWYLTQNGSTGIVQATAMAEIAGTMQPTMAGRTRADFAVDFLLADPYFYGGVQAQTLAYNTAVSINNLGDANVGMGQQSGQGGVPFTIQLVGPLTNPTVTNSTNGVSVTVAYTIGGGQSCTLDVLAYTALDQGNASHLGVVSHAGARPWMVLWPDINVLRLTSTNGGDTGHAVVTWQPGYL